MRNKRAAILTTLVLNLSASCGSNQQPIEPATVGATRDVVDPYKPPPGDQISQGLWWLYHLEYPQARQSFDGYITDHPGDPLGYFYRTALDWWQLTQKIEISQPELEHQFEIDFNDTVRVSQTLYETTTDPKKKALSLLCEGGAWGLRGRWLVVQNDWTKAYSFGKKGYRYLKQALVYDPELYDTYLGLGIYDYYTATLPGIKGFITKIMMNGNRERGLKELNLCLDKGNHARTEAALFLVQINCTFEKSPDKAVSLTQDLRKQFPVSPAIHLTEITALFEAHKYNAALQESQDFLTKSQNNAPFYSKLGLSPGRYFYGASALYGNLDYEECISNMNKILIDENPTSQWVTFAYLKRGQAYDLQGERAKATFDYKMVLQRKDVWNSRKDATKYLKRPFSLTLAKPVT